MKARIKITSSEEAVNIFRIATIASQNALAKGDSKTANANYYKADAAAKYLKSNGHGESLRPLLEDGEPAIITKAAAYLLSIDEETALERLEYVAQGNNSSSFNAKMIIKEWKAGNMQAFR